MDWQKMAFRRGNSWSAKLERCPCGGAADCMEHDEDEVRRTAVYPLEAVEVMVGRQRQGVAVRLLNGRWFVWICATGDGDEKEAAERETFLADVAQAIDRHNRKPSTMAAGWVCEECDGAGIVDGQPCAACDGWGLS